MGHKVRRKGPRRAYLKRFSSAMVNNGTGPSPNRDVLADLHHRAAHLGQPFLDREPWKLFSEDEKLAELWQSDWRQGLSHYNNITLTNGKYSRLKLYFRGLDWFFVKEDEITKRALRSISYTSRDRAMQRYNMGKITWKAFAHLPAPPG